MGCDIHCFVEIEQSYNYDGKEVKYWRKVGDVFKYQYYKEDRFPDDYNKKFTDELEIGRNYDLFSVLANVRNGTWGEEIKPISKPRGLPTDVSDEVKKISDDYDSDGHSHSHLTLDEIRAFDWEQKINHEAYVSKKQKEEYEKKGKKPNCYSAYSTIGVKMKWDETLKETIGGYFFNKIIPQLEGLEKWGKVRIVFWFDN